MGPVRTWSGVSAGEVVREVAEVGEVVGEVAEVVGEIAEVVGEVAEVVGEVLDAGVVTSLHAPLLQNLEGDEMVLDPLLVFVRDTPLPRPRDLFDDAPREH